MPWKDLVKVALLGTSRARLSDESLVVLAAQGVPSDASDEVKVLAGAAINARLRKAGYQPEKYVGDMPVADDEIEQSCSTLSTMHLQKILEHEEWRERLLPEWLEHLTTAQLQLPPELLPHLLQLAREQLSIYRLLYPAFGSRARWLAHLNPDWKPLFEKADESVWETAMHQQRLIIFRQWRETDVRKAMRMLQEIWPEELYQHKMDFLDVLSESLLATDEAFLEATLDDRRKEVRLRAAALLSRLPESAFADRMYQRAQQYLQLSTKVPKLNVSLPEKGDAAMLRDGIDPGRQKTGAGLKAGLLLQILSTLPAARWNDLLQADAEAGLEILVRSEWSELLVEGIVQATALHKDKECTACLLRSWIKGHEQPRWQRLNMYPLFDCLDDALFNEMAILSLQHSPPEVQEDIPATFLLKLQGFHWTDQLCFLTIKKLQSWVDKERNQYWNSRPYDGILENMAFSCRPALFDYFYHKWPRDVPAWMKLNEEIESFMTTLRFRKEMTEALINFSTD